MTHSDRITRKSTPAQRAVDTFVSTYRARGRAQPRIEGQAPLTVESTWKEAVRLVTAEVNAEQGEAPPRSR